MDSSNFIKYADENSTAEIYEPDARYENVITKEIQFIAPTDGEF